MTDASVTSSPAAPQVSRGEERVGILLVFLSALVWSFGGTIARFLEVDEAANMVAWLVSKENSFTTASVFDLSGGRATY